MRFDGGGVPSAQAPMIRLFLLGVLLLGLGVGVQRKWLLLDWPRMARDLNLPQNLSIPSRR